MPKKGMPDDDRWNAAGAKLSMLHRARVEMVPGLLLLRVEVSAPNDETGREPTQVLQIGLPPQFARQIGRQICEAADLLEGKGRAQ